jgi:adenylate cyclase
MAFPMIQVIFIYIAITFYKYLTEERKKKHLKSTFSKYVSPSIVDEILKDPENIQLGGRKQRMSVFFSDVRGFTTISEKLDPQVLSSVLNEYLTPMTNIVFENKGTLDKYMGDAVMAFFGAPIFFQDHAKYACRCAIQSIVKLKEIQEQFKARNLPTIDIGIGVNTGDMSVGNMGSDTVRSYTVMGDAVNLGSRLEGINKEYGTRIIISEFTHEDVKDSFTTREVDWVRVKGKYKPVKIFELICEGAASNEKQQVLKLYNEGYRLYRERNFDDAREYFKQALVVDPIDPVSGLYIERCEEYKQEPPPQDWDGVFIMKTK